MSDEKFHFAASLEQVSPGNMYRASVEGKTILLANVEGKVFAVDDMCSHEDASLYLGALKGECIKCPLHGSRFDLNTGEPLDDPADEPIQTYKVKIETDSIYVSIA